LLSLDGRDFFKDGNEGFGGDLGLNHEIIALNRASNLGDEGDNLRVGLAEDGRTHHLSHHLVTKDDFLQLLGGGRLIGGDGQSDVRGGATGDGGHRHSIGLEYCGVLSLDNLKRFRRRKARGEFGEVFQKVSRCQTRAVRALGKGLH
jgi:hypothetical protein